MIYMAKIDIQVFPSAAENNSEQISPKIALFTAICAILLVHPGKVEEGESLIFTSDAGTSIRTPAVFYNSSNYPLSTLGVQGEKMEYDQVTDEILVSRFQTGQMDAMDTLIRRHKVKAYNFALRLANDKDLAADVVAEAFLRMYRSAHSFKGQSLFTTWMFKIITNCFLDIQKKARRRPCLSLEYASLQDHVGNHKDMCSSVAAPHESLEKVEKDRKLNSVVSKLPDLHKIMIVLFHKEMMSYEEIAATLDLPIGTVKSRMNRARFSLRQALYPERSLFLGEEALSH